MCSRTLNSVSGLLLSFLILISFAVQAHAQSDVLIDLTMETRPEVRVAVLAFDLRKGSDPAGLGKEGRDILENDLKLFELFEPVSPRLYGELQKVEKGRKGLQYPSWKAIGVQWLIKTQYQVSGNNSGISLVFRLYDVVNQRFLVGKRYQGTPAYLRKMVHRFADEVMAQLTGKRGVAETQIAFLSETGKGKEMYVVDFDGHNPKRITRESSVLMAPDWSPDGRSIVFTSYKDRNPDLVMVDTKGTKRKILLRLPGLNSAPAWSPKGDKIALVLSKDQNSEVYVLDRFANLTRLTRHYNIDTSPTWSPDGSRIAFTSDRSGTGAPQIYMMDARLGDKNGVTRMTFSSGYNDNPAWSPEGDKIAYTALENGKFQIKIYDIPTKKTYNLTSGPGNKEDPTWSPDGQFIAFHYSLRGESSIHIQRVGGKKSRRLSRISGGGLSPTWSPYPHK